MSAKEGEVLGNNKTDQDGRGLEQVLRMYAEAGNEHDIETMISLFTPDCVFYSSTGIGIVGTPYIGQEKVRQGLNHFLKICPDGRWRDLKYFVSGDRGVMEWTFIGTTTAGEAIEVVGCDLITFKDGKIAIKDSYRKSQALL